MRFLLTLLLQEAYRPRRPHDVRVRCQVCGEWRWADDAHACPSATHARFGALCL